MSTDKARDGGIYYGWIVVASGFAILTTAFAIQYSFGVFFKPLQDTFGWSRAATSLAMTIHVVVFALFFVPVGWAVDRFDNKLLFSFAAVLVGSSLVLSSRITEIWQLYLVYGLPLAIGICICGPVIHTIITRWFVERRGVALGITSSGIGFGTLVGAPLTNALIEAYGWRNAFLLLGIGACVILLICARFIKSAPRVLTRQNTPVTINPGTKHKVTQAAGYSGMSLKEAIRTREMLLIVLTRMVAAFALRVVMVHIAPHALDIGISPSASALAIGTIGAASTVGRLVMGFVQDRIGPRRALIICMTAQGVSMLALPFLRSDLGFFVYAVVFGLTYGGDAPQFAALMAESFGLASIGVIYGLASAAADLFGGAAGPILAGYVFDVTNSYTVVFLAAGVSLFGGSFCVLQLKPDHLRTSGIRRAV